MAVSMGNAIRYLKYEIGKNLELPDEDVSFRVFFVHMNCGSRRITSVLTILVFSSLFCLTIMQARALFVEKIDNFIRDRITMADQVITSLGLQKIQDGDVILTYARSSVVQGLLLAAHAKGIKFKVIVVDSRPRFEGNIFASFDDPTCVKRLTLFSDDDLLSCFHYFQQESNC